MDVAGKVEELLIGFDAHRFKRTLEKWAHAFVFSVDILGKAIAGATNECGDTALYPLFDKQVEMVGHKDKTQDVDQWFACLLQFPK